MKVRSKNRESAFQNEALLVLSLSWLEIFPKVICSFNFIKNTISNPLRVSYTHQQGGKESPSFPFVATKQDSTFPNNSLKLKFQTVQGLSLSCAPSRATPPSSASSRRTGGTTGTRRSTGEMYIETKVFIGQFLLDNAPFRRRRFVTFRKNMKIVQVTRTKMNTLLRKILFKEQFFSPCSF